MNAILVKENPVEEYVIDDGKREIPVKNRFGEVLATLRFRTTDVNIVKRFDEAQKGVSEAVKSISDIDIASDGTAEELSGIEKLAQAEKTVKDKINYIFTDDVCSGLFSVCNPFSPINGRFYVENVIELLVKIIENELEKASDERISKYADDLA